MTIWSTQNPKSKTHLAYKSTYVFHKVSDRFLVSQGIRTKNGIENSISESHFSSLLLNGSTILIHMNQGKHISRQACRRGSRLQPAVDNNSKKRNEKKRQSSQILYLAQVDETVMCVRWGSFSSDPSFTLLHVTAPSSQCTTPEQRVVSCGGVLCCWKKIFVTVLD